MPSIGIHYLIVRPDEEGDNERRFTFFHLLQEGDTLSLRCLMALLHYPHDIERIVSNGHPFTEALLRVRGCPRFRFVSDRHLPATLSTTVETSPLLVVMSERLMPDWLPELARSRPVMFLSASEQVAKAAEHFEGAVTGTLQQFDDVLVFYGCLQRLCHSLDSVGGVSENTRTVCRALSRENLFSSRSRLGFVPPLPLPPAGSGRAAIYLLNRLSNNVDAPSLVQQTGDGQREWQILRSVLRACGLLAAVESAESSVLHKLGKREGEITEIRNRLLSTEENDTKLRLLLSLADGITNADWLSQPLITVPVPHSKLAKGNFPAGATPDPGDLKPRLRALNDFIEDKTTPTFQNPTDKSAYDRAIDTLWLEQRTLECQSAILASRRGLLPIQLRLTADDVFHELNQLNRAFNSNSDKATKLFRKMSVRLASHLPDWVVDIVRNGDSPIQFFSDLPMEWAQIDGWPICLTRPVSRLPIGATPWNVFAAAVEVESSIEATTPERVLVLDLIHQSDQIRRFSDDFAASSSAIGQRYQYATPTTAAEFREVVERVAPEIVVLDSHGRYDAAKDELWIDLPSGPVLVDELRPHQQVAPVWILSACDTSVTGAVRGCMVRQLLAMGAVCVVATLTPVDAFAASMFVGRLLTDVYNPVVKGMYDDFGEVFFATQVTTALLYDSLFPLMRRASGRPELRSAIGGVLGDYLRWTHERPISDIRAFRVEAAHALGLFLDRHNLADAMRNMEQSGRTRPETLLFTAFGMPKAVRIGFRSAEPS